MSGYGRFSVPLARPLETAQGPIDRREGFLIRLGDDPVGVGEATPLPGWTESAEECREAIERHLETASGSNELPPMGDTPAARHGLELARLDRAARAAGEPLYRHLGGGRRVSTMPVNATVGDGAVDETVAAAREAEEGGFPAIKLKVGAQPLPADLERASAVREAFGDRVELRVDANGAWSRETAAEAVDSLAELDVSLVEQPLARDDLDGAAEVRGRGVDIAADEALIEHDPEAVLDAGAADVLVLKPMVLGGLRAAISAAEAASDAGAGVIVTTTLDAVVARTAAVHLAAALDVDRPCGLATADRLAGDVGSDPAAVVDGGISVPQGAGHGVGVEALE